MDVQPPRRRSQPESDGATAPRKKAFLLARPEQRLLEAIARRLPAQVLPDHLTALALLAAGGFAAFGALGWLWGMAGLLVVQWLGDSLDGTLARVRRAERPRYGYYLDHLADAVSTALVGIGLGLTAHMHLTVALVLVIAYLALSINSYLETQALGVFTLGYGRLGPTEARLGLMLLLVVTALGARAALPLLGQTLTLLDVAALGAAGAMLVAGFARALGNLRLLALREPRAAG
ncbi:CDP-alcohol phosphatidyltransferase family protein [Candidatus Solirubrobacter pratensis]|uniref:CDP-alcohol phosphatidyltransferase family protein n=1 Tax=Candidatus Solirubrobacter pratensis TaxID=1298857 RepID=UPI00041CEB80|nr:CDP-alcohol phosphatidyltransferase family protein [Candidatus Solirubrobacter pratensis]